MIIVLREQRQVVGENVLVQLGEEVREEWRQRGKQFGARGEGSGRGDWEIILKKFWNRS
jgi:hypothetical protein